MDLRSGVILKWIRLISGDKSQQLEAHLTVAKEEQLNQNDLGINFHMCIFFCTFPHPALCLNAHLQILHVMMVGLQLLLAIAVSIFTIICSINTTAFTSFYGQ